MIPEEIFNQQVWEILQGIREEILATEVGKPVKYRIPSIVGAGIIPPDRRIKILYKLQEMKTFEIQRNAEGVRIGARDIFYLIINPPKFEEIYKKYQGFCNSEKDYITKISVPDNNTLKNIPIKVIIADLTSKYHEIEKETNQTQFFIKIAHYGQYILENRSTITILIPLYQEAKDDAKPYLKSWKDFVKLWKQYAKDILKKAVEVDIKDDPNNPLENEISNIKNHLNDEDTSVWETDLQYYYIPYMTLIWKFNKLKKSNLLVPKHLDPENKIVISDIYSGARDEWDKFKVSREAKVWWAHYQVCRLAAGVLGLKIGTNYFKRDNIIDGFYKYEFNELARGNPRDNQIVLHANKYAVWVKRLHEYLLPRLQELSTQTTQQNEIKGKEKNPFYQEQNRNREAIERQTETSGETPYCVAEKGIGYLKFGKHGTKKKIGKSDGRPFRLVQSLLEPHIGINKTVDAVFEAIRLPKDEQNSLLSSWNTGKSRKVDIIKYAIKELQKGNKLEGKLRFHFNTNETQLKAELVV